MNALEIRGLKKEYEGFSLDIESLTVPGGCVMGLVGENGAGKSTTIKLILDMIRADAGTVLVLGEDNHTDFTRRKESIGVVPDEIGLGGLTAAQVGKVMARVYKNWDGAAFARYLERLSIPREKVFEKLSQGMKKKLGIAVAMSHGARLLILDEATNGLDPVVREDVLDMLWEFTRDEENSVLISSHIVSDLEKICDYIAFLHEGRLLLCEEKDALVAEYGLLRCPASRLGELDGSAIVTRRITPYGAEALVRRDGVPAGTELQNVGVEEIFVAMVKGDKS